MPGNLETAAMVAELIGRAEMAMVATLNEMAEEIYVLSQLEVPRSEYHKMRMDPNYPEQSLADSAEIIEATPESLEAGVVYNSPYAGAQESGFAMQNRGGKMVLWEVQEYTTPGTKAHYLSDPAKAVIAQGEEVLVANSHLAFGGL